MEPEDDADAEKAPREEKLIRFEIQVPPDQEVGTYANLVSVWHSPWDFTLDFSVVSQGHPTEDAIVVPTRVVSRIKIPLTLAQDLLRALSENVDNFEKKAGRIHRPGDDGPLYLPEDFK